MHETSKLNIYIYIYIYIYILNTLPEENNIE
jgi:hypothetical protein